MKRMNLQILLATAAYYIHRANAQPREGRLDTPKWNKEADLDAIDALCVKAKFGFEASGGTFWFKKNGRVFEMNQSSWPNFVQRPKGE